MHKKNDFAEVSNNLAKCRPENIFISNIIVTYRTLKLKVAKMSKFFVALLSRLEFPT